MNLALRDLRVSVVPQVNDGSGRCYRDPGVAPSAIANIPLREQALCFHFDIAEFNYAMV